MGCRFVIAKLRVALAGLLGGSFTVSGTHTYASTGSFPITALGLALGAAGLYFVRRA